MGAATCLRGPCDQVHILHLVSHCIRQVYIKYVITPFQGTFLHRSGTLLQALTAPPSMAQAAPCGAIDWPIDPPMSHVSCGICCRHVSCIPDSAQLSRCDEVHCVGMVTNDVQCVYMCYNERELCQWVPDVRRGHCGSLVCMHHSGCIVPHCASLIVVEKPYLCACKLQLFDAIQW